MFDIFNNLSNLGILLNLDSCDGLIYPLLGKLAIMCTNRVTASSAKASCEDMGGQLVELETSVRIDGMITNVNNFNSRYGGKHILYNIYLNIS